MSQYVYEIHKISSPLLPFLFRPRMEVTKRRSLANWHENTELLYCMDGRGTVQLGRENVPFEKGDLVVVNSDVPHAVSSTETVIYFVLILQDSFLRENGIDVKKVEFESRICRQRVRELAEELRCAFAEFSPDRFDGSLQVRCAVLKLLCLLCADHAAPCRGERGRSDSVRRAMEYIRKHYSTPMTLDEIASAAGVSKFHLSREFKEYTGMPPMQTVIQLRLQRAREAIERGECVSAAARAAGFSNLSYFTERFFACYGFLPSRLKKQAKEK